MGDAVAFRVSSLGKLQTMKSNVPQLTLLRFIVEEVDTNNPDTLEFVNDMLNIFKTASRYKIIAGIILSINAVFCTVPYIYD